ncbi:hypothetical protein GOODEAATRI_017446 [Goodea atripinnis]|uniref:Vacuolar protein sorting-associated protein 13 VPS13 adaptor binding domain-containing protein n=1 Tax=Goodea atripinnis TaxID=208336 RepID=A0ABV0N276_9TELE
MFGLSQNSADVYELQEGCTSDLLNARVSGEIMSLALIQYQGRGWHGHIQIDRNLPEFFAVCLTCDSDGGLTVDVSVHVTKTSSRLLLSLYSPYWIINKTSRVLQYRSEDVIFKHPAEYRDVVLFSFKKSNLFTKSKVGVSIQMSSFNLTRIVTLSPFYTLVNKSLFELEVGELISQTSIRWNYIPSTECGGIIVNINVSNHSNIISFSDYYDGAAPALLINHTPWASISYTQRLEVTPRIPQTLKEGLAKRAKETRSICFLQDDVSQFPYDEQSQIHWVSFLDGRQRVLLFTEDTGVVTKARQSEELEQFQQELKVSLQNLGLSLINNGSRQEIAYIGITR